MVVRQVTAPTTEAILDQYTDPANGPVQEAPRPEQRGDTPTVRELNAKEPPSRKGEFIQPLADLYGMIALGVSVLEIQTGNADHNCARTIDDNAVAIAEAWDNLARTNDNVRRVLRKLTAGGAWGGVLMAHLPIAIAIGSNHMPGVIPEIHAPSEQAQPQDQPTAPEASTLPGEVSPPRKRATAKRTPPRRTTKTAQAVNKRRSTV